MNKCIGVLGGLGPQATVLFMEDVIKWTEAERDQEHVNCIVIQHASVPDRTAFILDSSKADPFPFLLEDVRKLTECGVECIVLPCNTAHYFYGELQSSTDVPIIHMIRETVETMAQEFPDLRKVGILATEGTIASGLYHQEMEGKKMQIIATPAGIQEDVNTLIYEQVKKQNDIDFGLYMSVLDRMANLGCEGIILGCTELSVVHSQFGCISAVEVIDAQQVLVKKTIQIAGKKSKYRDALASKDMN
ncbi:aspartate/glutamate racemase family protein [Bacillus sp. 1P06AnD]|uniref:aspartate/glutamate racemase family protein n=1 Tax=Bacillus sp. 1P06AnD TaxID=3132208 RepID=UPI0039A3B079